MRALLVYAVVTLAAILTLALAWFIPGNDLRSIVGALLIWGWLAALIGANYCLMGKIPNDSDTILTTFSKVFWAIKAVPLFQGLWVGLTAEHAWLVAALYLLAERAVVGLAQGPVRPTDDPRWRPSVKSIGYSAACLAVGILISQGFRRALALS